MKPMESKRQRQVSSTLQKQMSEVFLERGSSLFGKRLVNISHVRVTSDLMLARFYISIINAEEPKEVLEIVRLNVKALRQQLAQKIRKQFRRIPEIEFYIDDSTEEMFKMEELFNKINRPKDK